VDLVMVKRFTPGRRGSHQAKLGNTVERRNRWLPLSEPARHALVLSRKEAQLLDCGFVGTEHLLLGLVREGKGRAAAALGSLGVTLEAVRGRARELVGPAGSSNATPPLTPRSRAVLRLAQREARQLGHEAVGTEHLLLALVREGEGVGVEILNSLGVSPADVRRETEALLPGGGLHRPAEPHIERMQARAGRDRDQRPPEPRCGWCRQPLVLRVRTIEAAPDSVQCAVVYCARCGSALGTVPPADQG
jgi:Clp amino terminal domain, pathogenicity island component